MRGPHDSALEEEAITNFADKPKEKVASNQARLVCYKIFKGYFPTKMKVSPIAATPHKSKAFKSPHHPKANIGVVLIHQYYQQIIR